MLKWQYPHDSALEHWAALLQSSGIDDSNLRNDGPADTDMLRDKRIAKRLGSVLAWPSRLARPGLLADTLQADLIVLGSHSQPTFNDVLHQDATRTVLQSGRIAVLLYRWRLSVAIVLPAQCRLTWCIAVIRWRRSRSRKPPDFWNQAP